MRIRGSISNLGKGTRLAILAVLLVAGGVIAYLLNGFAAEQPVEFELKADQGETSFELVSETDGVSPGCGCPEPELGEQHWQGMSIPSTNFDLDVDTDRSEEVADGLWSLTVLAPNTGPMDWFGMPNHAIWMYVDAIHPDGSFTTLFAGPANHLLVWSDEPVGVHHPPANPYAAILPASGGTTEFSSREASRAQWGARVDVSSSTPERPAESVFGRDYWENSNLTQRGPMIDVLGPWVRFTLPYTARTKVFAAAKAIRGAQPKDRLAIGVSTPFALRLIPHPVQRGWQEEITQATQSGPKHFLDGDASLGDDLPKEAVARDRVLLKQALPGYDVRLSDIQAPSRATWNEFAARSAKQDLTWTMMGETRLDPLESTVYHRDRYALPPVTTRPQIGVFGRINDFESTSVGARRL